MKSLVLFAALVIAAQGFAKSLEDVLILPGMTREEAATRLDRTFPSSEQVMQGSVKILEEEGVVAVFLEGESVVRTLYQWDAETTRRSPFDVFRIWRDHYDSRATDAFPRLRLGGVWLVGESKAMDPPDEDIVAITYFDDRVLILELTLTGADLRSATSGSRTLKVEIFGNVRNTGS